jgi:hypothetical protein
VAKAQQVKLDVLGLEDALQALKGVVKTQSGKHMKPLNRHLANRLVIEGGFPPEWVHPRPGMSSKLETNRRYFLQPGKQDDSERQVLGGIKYKNVDISTFAPGIGPAICLSTKATTVSFRNLTNRMEEALGECVNIHMMYPGALLGFLHCIRFARPDQVADTRNASFTIDNFPIKGIVRYHDVLATLSGRNLISDPPMLYEAVAMLVYQEVGDKMVIWNDYPPEHSPVHYKHFFERLYKLYDIRFSYPNPRAHNTRKEWTLKDLSLKDVYDESTFRWEPRFNGGGDEDEEDSSEEGGDIQEEAEASSTDASLEDPSEQSKMPDDAIG